MFDVEVLAQVKHVSKTLMSDAIVRTKNVTMLRLSLKLKILLIEDGVNHRSMLSRR